MCGIAGSINFNLSPNLVNKAMIHRGPDEQSGTNIANVSLQHLRLAIIDIDGGKQPMEFEDRYTLIFNGQIYNYKDLIEEHSLKLKTHSDTEVVLHMFAKFGIACLSHFDGMFAFALYDKQSKDLYLARDRAGKKPLYIYRNGNSVVFASELNCLNTLLDLEIDEDLISSYLRFGVYFRSKTPYKNVTEIESGHFIKINADTLESKTIKWWDIQQNYLKPRDLDFNQSISELDRILNVAVKRRLLASDLEVGAFLSGGIDSGLVTSIASKYTQNLKTFTVAFDGTYDETALAQLVADKYDTNHHTIRIDFSSLNNDVENILYNYGEPFADSSAIPSYYVSKEAKKYVTVVLNGDGADELFGGYRRYVPFSKMDIFNIPNTLRSGVNLISKVLPAPKNKMSKYNYLYRLLSLMSRKNIDCYLSTTSDIFENYESKLLTDNTETVLKNEFDQIVSQPISGLSKLMLLDFQSLLFSALLVKMDIATMSNSLEGRSPFLGKDILNFAPTLKDSTKINGVQTKYILRELAKKYLPDQLINQPKRGFEIPLKKWVNDELKEVIQDYLNSSNAIWKNYLDPIWFKKVISNKIPIPEEKRAKMLWTIFSLEVWNKKRV